MYKDSYQLIFIVFAFMVIYFFSPIGGMYSRSFMLFSVLCITFLAVCLVKHKAINHYKDNKSKDLTDIKMIDHRYWVFMVVCLGLVAIIAHIDVSSARLVQDMVSMLNIMVIVYVNFKIYKLDKEK